MAVKGSAFTPWSYQKGNSFLHRLPAGLKLFFLLLISAAAFFNNIIVLSSIAFFLAALSFAAGICPLRLLRGSANLFFVVLAVFLLQGLEFSPFGINADGLFEALIFCARLGTAFAAGSLLFYVTTSGEIRKSISRAESFFHPKRPSLSIYFSLMLGFLPLFFEIWEDINLAWKSRGGKKNFSRLVVLLPLVIEKMMIKAAEKAAALESRGALQATMGSSAQESQA